MNMEEQILVPSLNDRQAILGLIAEQSQKGAFICISCGACACECVCACTSCGSCNVCACQCPD